MAAGTTTRRDFPGLLSTDASERDPGMLDGAYVDALVESAGGATALDAEGIEDDSVQPVEVEALLGAAAKDEVVFTVLAIRDDHLKTFWALDNAAVQAAVTNFITDRPFLTVDDAMRAVLRSFGVRAKSLPSHVNPSEWDEQGWQLVETGVTDLTQARLLG